MPDRIIGHARHSRDECPCHPTVPVVMHDEAAPHRVDGAVGQCSATKFGVPCAYDQDEPPEITEARANLPANPEPVRDWFRWYAEAGR